jgi:hypothetical protein
MCRRRRFEPLSARLGPLGRRGSVRRLQRPSRLLEELWISGAGSAEEPEVLQRHGQGCVERSGGQEVPNLPLSAPNGVHSSLLHLRSSWRNCLDIRNGGDSGLRKQSRGGEGIPIGRLLRPKKWARDDFSSSPNCVSTRWVYEVVGDPNRPFRSHPGEDPGISRSYSWSGRRGVWSPPCRSLPRNLCNPPRLCRGRR